MTWIETTPPGRAEGELARAYAAAIARAGRVFGIVRAMSPNPDALNASMRFYLAIMFGPSPLTRATRELLAVVVSRTNACVY